jgi:hypothetical protein
MLNRLDPPGNFVDAPDADATKLPYWPITGGVWAMIGATCSQAGGSITYRLIFTDAAGVLTGVAPPITLVAATGPPDFGSEWLGTPNQPPCVNICADRMAMKVDAVVGEWSVNAQVFTPPPAGGGS